MFLHTTMTSIYQLLLYHSCLKESVDRIRSHLPRNSPYNVIYWSLMHGTLLHGMYLIIFVICYCLCHIHHLCFNIFFAHNSSLFIFHSNTWKFIHFLIPINATHNLFIEPFICSDSAINIWHHLSHIMINIVNKEYIFFIYVNKQYYDEIQYYQSVQFIQIDKY